MSDTTAKPAFKSLDTRIASALNGEDVTPALLSDLIIAVEDALPVNAKASEAERIRMLDPTNPDPEKSRQMLDRITLERERLQAALPLLEARYHKAEHRELKQALLPEYNRVVGQYNQCSETLHTLYSDFIEQFVPLLNTVLQLNADIRRMNAETRSKGLTELATIPTLADVLLEHLVLPSPSGVNYWPDPKLTNAVAVQWSNAVAQAYSSPLRQAACSPDWHEARKLMDAEKIKEWNRRNALREEQQLNARREFERSKH